VAQLKVLNPAQVSPYPLKAQAVALKAACLVLPHLRSVPAAYRDLGDQATRAVTSVALNLAEGSGRAGRDRCNHFRIAYHQPRFLLKNLAIQWGIDPAVSPCTPGRPDWLEERIKAVFDASPGEYVTKDDCARIAYEMVMGGLEERAPRGLTGEWLIFARHEGEAVFLTFATHKEGREAPEKIRRRIDESCVQEFPFLGAVVE